MKTVQVFGLIALLAGSAVGDDPLVVTTSGGRVRGYRATSRAGRNFLAFSGVPYAKPPVGSLRFQPPAELESWSGVRNATQPGPYCLQFTTFEEIKEPLGSEDCLYLSVYTHNTRGRVPVMVHFHGGGFHMGNGEQWTEPHFFMDQDVVVVDVNYRLTYLGFLCFEDKEMPGNQGLKDQVMALKWVQKNIAKFGGDPNKVTIFGESAGGGSVYLHTVSPLSRGLFHRAIGESGAGYNPWSLAPPGFARSKALQLTKNIGCPTSSTSAAVSCLKSKNGSEIVARYQDVVEWQIDMDIIFPCLEPEGPGAFVTAPISRWHHQPVPMLLGFTSGEGLIRTDYFYQNKTDFKWLNKNFPRLAPLSLWYKATASNPDQVTKKVLNYYFPGGEITPDLWFNLTQMYSDSWFTAGIIEGANLHTGDVYMYYFDYIGEYSYDEKRSNSTIYFAPSHIEETEFLWQRPWARNRTLNKEDLTLSQTLVKLWTNFARDGKPTPGRSQLSWRKWNPRTHTYFHISHAGLQTKEGLAKDRYRFWKTTNYRDNFK